LKNDGQNYSSVGIKFKYGVPQLQVFTVSQQWLESSTRYGKWLESFKKKDLVSEMSEMYEA